MMVVLGPLAAVAIVVLMTWFWKLELADRRNTIFAVAAITFLVEIVLSGPFIDVPRGILRLSVAGSSVRPIDVVLVAALGARGLGGRTNRVGVIGFSWAPFILLYAAGVFVGVARDLPLVDVVFQGKVAFYIVGGALVASGADVGRVVRALPRVGLALAPLVPIGLLMRITGFRVSIDTPLQRFVDLGVLSTAALTVLVGVGGAVILAEVVRNRPRVSVLVAGTVLLLAPLTGQQRASYLSLLGVAIVLMLLAAGSTWRRRSTVTVTEMVLGFSAMMGAVFFGFLVTNQSGVVVRQVEGAFTGVGNQQSAEERVRIYDESFAAIGENPVLGSGVGSQVSITRVATGVELDASAHNILLDLWLRIGLVGVVLFAVAMSVTIWVAVKVWRQGDPAAAAVAAGGLAVIMAFLLKAVVEPAIDNYRLSLLLGFAVGGIAASLRDVDDRTHPAVVDRTGVDRLTT